MFTRGAALRGTAQCLARAAREARGNGNAPSFPAGCVAFALAVHSAMFSAHLVAEARCGRADAGRSHAAGAAARVTAQVSPRAAFSAAASSLPMRCFLLDFLAAAAGLFLPASTLRSRLFRKSVVGARPSCADRASHTWTALSFVGDMSVGRPGLVCFSGRSARPCTHPFKVFRAQPCFRRASAPARRC